MPGRRSDSHSNNDNRGSAVSHGSSDTKNRDDFDDEEEDEEQQQQQQQEQPYEVVTEVEEIDETGVHASVVATIRLSQLHGPDDEPEPPLLSRSAVVREEEENNQIETAAARTTATAIQVNQSTKSTSLANLDYETSGDDAACSNTGAKFVGHRRISGFALAAHHAVTENWSENNEHSSHHHHDADAPPPPPPGPASFRPAQFLCAIVYKKSDDQNLGLHLRENEPVIESIDRSLVDEGNPLYMPLLRHCPFQPGHRILSINGHRTKHMTSSQGVANLIHKEKKGSAIAIVCQNESPDADPQLIETMVTRSPSHKSWGMGLQSHRRRDLRVKSINPRSPFAQSLLSVGDHILSINQVDVTSRNATEAIDTMRESTDLTLIAMKSHRSATVVAEISQRGFLRASVQHLQTVAARPIPNRNDDVDAAYDDDVCDWKLFGVLFGFCCVPFLLVALSAVNKSFN